MNRGPSTTYYIRQLDRVSTKLIENQLKPLGVTRAQVILLTLAAQDAGASSADLARLRGVSPQAVSRDVGALEAAGLIERSEAADSQKILLVRLTPKGEDVLNAGLGAFYGADDQILAALSPRERATLRRLLIKAVVKVRPSAVAPELMAAVQRALTAAETRMSRPASARRPE